MERTKIQKKRVKQTSLASHYRFHRLALDPIHGLGAGTCCRGGAPAIEKEAMLHLHLSWFLATFAASKF